MPDKPRKKYDIKNFSNFGKFDQKRGDRRPRREQDPPGLAVVVHGDDVMKAYRRLKKKIMKDDLMDTIRDKRYYKKPSERRQEKLKNWLASVNFSKRNIVEEDGAEIKTYVPL